jgi:hypothetical protein
MATKKKSSLVGNINKRKKAGTSRSKADSTVSREAFFEMKKGWPKSHRPRTSPGRKQSKRAKAN